MEIASYITRLLQAAIRGQNERLYFKATSRRYTISLVANLCAAEFLSALASSIQITEFEQFMTLDKYAHGHVAE